MSEQVHTLQNILVRVSDGKITLVIFEGKTLFQSVHEMDTTSFVVTKIGADYSRFDGEINVYLLTEEANLYLWRPVDTRSRSHQSTSPECDFESGYVEPDTLGVFTKIASGVETLFHPTQLKRGSCCYYRFFEDRRVFYLMREIGDIMTDYRYDIKMEGFVHRSVQGVFDVSRVRQIDGSLFVVRNPACINADERNHFIFLKGGPNIVQYDGFLADPTGKIPIDSISLLDNGSGSQRVYYRAPNQDGGLGYYSVNLVHAGFPNDGTTTARRYHFSLKGAVSTTSGEGWLVSSGDDDQHTLIWVLSYPERVFDFRLSGLRKVVQLWVSDGLRSCPGKLFLLLEADDPRVTIEVDERLSIINLSRLVSGFSQVPAHEIYYRPGHTTWHTNQFYYRDGNKVMYFSEVPGGQASPTLFYELREGEEVHLTCPPIISTKRHLFTIVPETRQKQPITGELFMGNYPIVPLVLPRQDSLTGVAVEIQIVEGEDPVRVGLGALRSQPVYNPSQGDHIVNWVIRTPDGRVIQKGEEVTRRIQLELGEKIKRYLIPSLKWEWLSPRERERLSRRKAKFFDIGVLLRKCCIGGVLPELPISLYAGLKHGKWSRELQDEIPLADLAYFIRMRDLRTYEYVYSLSVCEDDLAHSPFKTVRQACESYCGNRLDSTDIEVIDTISRGFASAGSNPFRGMNLGSIRAALLRADV